MQEPILVVFEISGRVSRSIFCNLAKASKLRVSGLKSEIFDDKSLIFPFLSKTAGFSLFLFPHLNNFISVIYNFTIFDLSNLFSKKSIIF